jgi:hypothetical protein
MDQIAKNVGNSFCQLAGQIQAYGLLIKSCNSPNDFGYDAIILFLGIVI